MHFNNIYHIVDQLQLQCVLDKIVYTVGEALNNGKSMPASF